MNKEQGNPHDEFERLKTYCGECFNELRKIYSAYGAMGGGGGSVSFYEFSSLVRDCRLISSNWTQADLTLTFVKTNIEIDEETGERISIDHNPDSALTTTEFVEILIRIARKYAVIKQHKFLFSMLFLNMIIDCSLCSLARCAHFFHSCHSTQMGCTKTNRCWNMK